MSYTTISRPTTSSLERRLTRIESYPAKLEAARSVRFYLLAEEARRAVKWGVKRGLLAYPNDNDNNQPNGGAHHDE